MASSESSTRGRSAPRSGIRGTSSNGGSASASRASRRTTRGWNMLPEPVEEAIHAIADDRRSGASKLARIALDTMELAIMEAKGRPDPKALTEVARRISPAQPAMAIGHNLVRLFPRLVSEGHAPKAVIDATRRTLDGAR